MTDPIVLPFVLAWPDALMLAAVTAGVWTALAMGAERLVAEARERPRRSGPSRPTPSRQTPSRRTPLRRPARGLPRPR